MQHGERRDTQARPASQAATGRSGAAAVLALTAPRCVRAGAELGERHNFDGISGHQKAPRGSLHGPRPPRPVWLRVALDQDVFKGALGAWGPGLVRETRAQTRAGRQACWRGTHGDSGSDADPQSMFEENPPLPRKVSRKLRDKSAEAAWGPPTPRERCSRVPGSPRLTRCFLPVLSWPSEADGGS